MRLYNILVVDDEAFVVDWLVELLEAQEDYTFNIYPVYNAIKAMEWIERTRIDLLISDIRMPNLTGFELVERANELWPLCKSILLTAHAEFEYAQKAIGKGVLSYILKTEDDTHIINEVKKALTLIDMELDQQKLIADTQKNLNNSLTQLKNQVFFQWIRGNHLNRLELEKYIEILGFQDGPSSYCLLIGALDNTNPSLQNQEQLSETLKFFQAKTIIEHFIEPYIKHYVTNNNHNKAIWILQPNDNLTNRFTSLMTGALEIAQQSCAKTTGITASFVISVPTDTASDIAEAYFIGKSLLSNHTKDNFILSYLIADKPQTNDKDTLPVLFQSMDLPKSTVFSSMKKYLENGNRQEFIDLLHSVCAQIGHNVNWHNNRMLETYYSTVLVFISYINQRNLTPKLAFKTSLGILFRPWLAASWSDIEKQFISIANLIFDFQEETKKRTSQDIIQDVVSYIQEHVLEDIALIDLSDLTGYSTSYLSKFFSDNFGSTISDYIAKCKIEKIRELMLDNSLNIGDIAKKVGFNSRTYFNNYFKRNVGIAPQQYREQMLSQIERDI
jgi:two-component system response regulator YesN